MTILRVSIYRNENNFIYISFEQLRMIKMQWTSTIEIFAVLSKCGFHHPVSLEKWWQIVILKNSPLHLKIRVKSAGHRTVSGWSLTTPYGARPGIGRCYHIRRRPAPVRYVTTQEKILKNSPVPGRLSNSPVMCKSVKSYDVSFICDHSIKTFHANQVHVLPVMVQQWNFIHLFKASKARSTFLGCVHRRNPYIRLELGFQNGRFPCDGSRFLCIISMHCIVNVENHQY